jgi:16S rRNA (guanine(527)-N(7))-methyltransferase RsmG
MPNASDAGYPAPLPTDLIPDFERFRAALRERAGAGDGNGGVLAVLSRPEAEAAWREYGRLLYEKSVSLALLAKGDRGSIFTRHVQDSLNVLSLFDPPPASVLDVGSGGGLPGIPLAIGWPDTRVVLLESRERKSGFLEQAVRGLRLRHASVLCSRLEDVHEAWRGDLVDAVLVRAVGDLPRVLKLASSVTRPAARWVYFLGSKGESEALPEGSGFDGRVEEGLFGGRLLTGVFREPT